MQLRAKSKKGGFAWVNRKIFERLASKEEERKSESYFNRNRGEIGAIAGAGIAGYPVVKNEIDRANHLNAVNEREYLDAKDRNIRYRYSQAQSNAIRGQMDGMNEELGLTADKKNWTQCQRELREGHANKIRSASLHRRDAYFICQNRTSSVKQSPTTLERCEAWTTMNCCSKNSIKIIHYNPPSFECEQCGHDLKKEE